MSEKIDDFGFTFDNERDDSKLTEYEETLSLMKRFLKNLKGPVDQDVIKWPGKNRHEQIDNMLNKISNIEEM